MTLGEKIQTLRAESSISQEELAHRLGVSRQAVSKWELDKTVPDVKYIVALSDLFHITTDALLKDGEPTVSADAATPQPASPVPHDRSATLVTLLCCGNGFLLALIMLSFLMPLFFRYPAALWPLYLVLVLGLGLFFAGRSALPSPARALRRYRRASAWCLTLWGAALALLLGYQEVIEDLLFDQVLGLSGVAILLFLTAMLIGSMYLVSYLLVLWMTRSVQA